MLPGAPPGVRRGISRDKNIFAFDCRTAINAMLALRSAISAVLPRNVMHMHGAVVSLAEHNRQPLTIAILGSAGSGKSHMIGSLLAREQSNLSVLAEDSALADVEFGVVTGLGEGVLLVKDGTVERYSPSDATPILRDPSDATRGLYSSAQMFGHDPINKPTPLDAIVLLQPGEVTPYTRTLLDSDYSWIKRGDYSPYYRDHEQLLDGSTETFDESEIVERLQHLRRVTSRVPSFLLLGSTRKAAPGEFDGIIARLSM